MQRQPRPEGLDLSPPQLQRKQSKSIDRTPSIGSSLMSPPPVTPDPAYIAASAASQIVTTDRADRGQDSPDGEGKKVELESGAVSPASLTLVNAFLDQLLFSFLASSRSTSIAALRPAIVEVLKPRLAKEAVDGADEELQGYLAGGDAEELLAFHSGQDFKGEYNLNLVWRRTRLRCMVYTRLGDMEEEDEDIYIEREQEEEANDGRRRLSRDLGTISPAAAIFLTSILEFIGERALLVAGDAAYYRMQSKQPKAEDCQAIVEQVDMEKIAFNATLGRLWRSWKKKVRVPSLLNLRPASRGLQRHKSSSLPDTTSRKASISEEDEASYFNPARRPSVAEVLHEDWESAPISQRRGSDLPDEPDFSDFAAEKTAPEVRTTNRGRPRSMVDFSKPHNECTTRTPTQSLAPNGSSSPGVQERPTRRRQRSSSLPAKRQNPLVSPLNESFITPLGGPNYFLRDNDRLDAENEMPKLTDDSTAVPGNASGASVVSTMYDGAIVHGAKKRPEDNLHRTDRGIGSYTDSSSYTDEYDHDMKPEALDLKKPSANDDNVSAGLPDSRDSTISSNYSLQVGEMDPVIHPRELDQTPVGNENQSEEGVFPVRADSLDQPRIEMENAPQPSVPVGNFANIATLQGHQLRTYDESGKAVKRDIPVLYEAPSNQDVIYNPEATVRSRTGLQDEGELSSPARAGHQRGPSGGSQQGVPTLTPLKELMDAALDTSDEGSSSAPSYDTPRSDGFVPTHRFQGSDGLRSGSLSSVSVTHAQPSPVARKSVDPRNQPLALNTGTERAAVQRVSPASAATRDLGTPNTRTSTSSNRPMTANSTSSKIKGMMGRESGDLIRQPVPKRYSSSEGSGSFMNGSLMAPKSGDKEQDFEDLIKSNETVKYTLTPQNMREMEAPDSPRWQAHSRSGTGDRADFVRNSALVNARSESFSTGRSFMSLRGLNGLRSNPTNSPTEMSNGPTASTDTPRAQPQALPMSPSARSGRVVSSREATMKDDSLRDFADFIRSTGPGAEPRPVPRSVTSNVAKSSRPTSSSTSQKAAGPGVFPPKKITKQGPVATPKKSGAVPPKKNLPKLQAREATVIYDNATADLADFLRSGPMVGQVNGTPQTQRSVATMKPTITTNGISNGSPREAVNSGSSIASTQDSFAHSKMTISSADSRTGLIDNSNRAPPVRNNNKRPPRNDEPPGPMRKQHRVRDPYALDSDSEGENGYATTLQPPVREEESLSDFLRNYTPPPAATSARNSTGGITGAPKTAKSSGPTIRERLSRNIAVIPDYRPLPPKAPKKPSTSRSPPQSNESRKSAQRQNSATSFQPPNRDNVVRSRSSNAAPQLPPLNPRPTSPHLISQNGTKMDSYRPTQPTYARHVDWRPKHLQAREEQGISAGPPSGGGLGDLADFLRETEPPAPSGAIGGWRPMSPSKEKEESTFGRMFRLRKKEMK